MTYVYLIESISEPAQRYVGQTSDLKVRVQEHNAGKSLHTAKYRPWNLVSYHAFADEKKAWAFEGYLKSGVEAGFC